MKTIAISCRRLFTHGASGKSSRMQHKTHKQLLNESNRIWPKFYWINLLSSSQKTNEWLSSVFHRPKQNERDSERERAIYSLSGQCRHATIRTMQRIQIFNHLNYLFEWNFIDINMGTKRRNEKWKFISVKIKQIENQFSI